MYLTADKPDADVAYLTSAIARQALVQKFQQLFGRDPVARDNTPMYVQDTKVPDIVLQGVDPTIAPMLQASAVEHSEVQAGELPESDKQVLLYVIADDQPAQIALSQVKEYQEMDGAARDVVVHDAAEQGTMNIEDNVAYLSKDLSTIHIGIYVLKTEFAAEFEHQLANAGGKTLADDKKLQVFDELFTELPASAGVLAGDARTQLLQTVGLAQGSSVPTNMRAPGPGGEADKPQ